LVLAKEVISMPLTFEEEHRKPLPRAERFAVPFSIAFRD
jgi:hypothetical protein